MILHWHPGDDEPKRSEVVLLRNLVQNRLAHSLDHRLTQAFAHSPTTHGQLRDLARSVIRVRRRRCRHDASLCDRRLGIESTLVVSLTRSLNQLNQSYL